jgi:hypothetical protein
MAVAPVPTALAAHASTDLQSWQSLRRWTGVQLPSKAPHGKDEWAHGVEGF